MTDEQKWTPEPWSYVRHEPDSTDWSGNAVWSEGAGEVVAADVERESDSARIVACVNALAGIENPRLCGSWWRRRVLP